MIGCDGLVVTDEMRVTIAAQACLLILNRRNRLFLQPAPDTGLSRRFIVDRVHADSAGVSGGPAPRPVRRIVVAGAGDSFVGRRCSRRRHRG